MTAIALVLVGCAHQKSTPLRPAYIEGKEVEADLGFLINLHSDSTLPQEEAGKEIKQLRPKTLSDEGYKIGFEAGLSRRYSDLLASLKSRQAELDSVYNFDVLLIDSVVLPPVISRVENPHTLIDQDTARSAMVSYRIDHPARVVTLAPTWREFLWAEFPKPKLPHWGVLPRTDEERLLWRDRVIAGWHDGVKHANSLFEVNLNLLNRTYQGMLHYKMLLAQGVVSKPILSRADLGIVSDGRTLTVGDTIYRLTANSQFQPAQTWKPAPFDTQRQ